jgi:iron(II)-dependent oxidoreductase
MALSRIFRRRPGGRTAVAEPGPAAREKAHPQEPHDVPAEPAPSNDDPLTTLSKQQRHALVITRADEWRSRAESESIVAAARRELDQRLAFVPEGLASLGESLAEHVGAQETNIHVSPFLLEIHTVTNARFQHFVDAGGYEELDLWPKEIWPHLIEMQDQTGQFGPRFWRHGRHDQRKADHPVVGVSWFEADAFARWIGQRLPSEAEWQMAATWHLMTDANILRRFPWGDAMEHTRCNVWSTRLGDTVTVDTYPEGAAPNGVRQLIGNVWEWTASEFEIADYAGRPIVGEMPMRCVRGGAFDTYFESQATGLFRTGQITMGRTHNTGFRCAMDLPAS